MKNKKLVWIIGIVSAVAAISAALTAFFIVKDKQKRTTRSLWNISTAQSNKPSASAIKSGIKVGYNRKVGCPTFLVWRVNLWLNLNLNVC